MAAYVSVGVEGLRAVDAPHVIELQELPQVGRPAGRRAAAAGPGLHGHLCQAPGTRQQFTVVQALRRGFGTLGVIP